MKNIVRAIQAQAKIIDGTWGQPRFGTVSSFDSTSYMARVLFQPEGILSGWLPILSGWTGAGWGMVCPLSTGDQVFVLAQEGATEHGVIVGRAFSRVSPPPSAPDDECWIVHQSGSSLRLRSDGTVLITGDLHVAGQVFDQHGSLDHLRTSFDNHSHVYGANAHTSYPNTVD